MTKEQAKEIYDEIAEKQNFKDITLSKVVKSHIRGYIRAEINKQLGPAESTHDEWREMNNEPN